MFHDKRWICNNPDMERIKALTETMGIARTLAIALINRGIKTAEEGERFLYPRLEHLFDPYLMQDMEASVDRIMLALDREERICIYGDYDVDGITSVSFLMRLLGAVGADAIYFIPNRKDEGYGLNEGALSEIHKAGTTLIITVDCGIASHEEVISCTKSGMDVIITDHHLCQKTLPPALGVINPRRSDSLYPFKELAGVGVAYKLGVALEKAMQRRGTPILEGGGIGPEQYNAATTTMGTPFCNNMLDIVALGTVADIVPLIGENRVLVSIGLKQMETTKNMGLNALLEVSGIVKDGGINAGRIAFGLAPRLNAAGRLADAQRGVELLLEDDRREALIIAKELDARNRDRQILESDIMAQAIKMAEKKTGDSILILGSEDWHPGVIGIAASRIVEMYNKPAVLFHIAGDEARGSARGVPGLDLYGLLSHSKQYYKSFGGHMQAAGLTINKDDLDEFALDINDAAREVMEGIEKRCVLYADMDLTGIDLTVEDAKELKLLEPCGCGNLFPLFVKRCIEVEAAKRVGKQKEHLKVVMSEKGKKFDGIAFRWTRDRWPYDGQRPDVIFSPKINDWLGRQQLQLLIRDIKDLSKEYSFLKAWHNSLSGLCDIGNRIIVEETTMDFCKGKDTAKAGQSFKDIFRGTVGNILILNGFKSVINTLSDLLLYSDTEVVFSEMKDYSEHKNLIIINPSSFKGMEKCRGKIYFFAQSILAQQLQAITNINNTRPVVLYDESIHSLKKDLFSILPSREEAAFIYRLIKKRNTINFYDIIRLSEKRDINPAKTVLIVEGLKSAELVEEENRSLFVLPAPKTKTEFKAFIAFDAIKTTAKSSEAGYNAVKEYSFDV